MCVKDNEKFKTEFSEIISNAVEKVNKDYNLRRSLGCETQYGKRYSEIH